MYHVKQRIPLWVWLGIALLVALAASDAMAACGLKPLPPIGCSGDAICICDDEGCRWVWICE